MKNDELESNLKDQLNSLKQVAGRNPRAAAHGRESFLKQAVSLKRNQRQNGWINNLFPFVSDKETLPMLKPMMTLILVMILLFGVAAGTVYAAQESLPGQALYPIKTWSEDLLLAGTRSPQAQLEKNLEFSDRRVMEIASLQASGLPIPQQVQIRLQTELNQALKLAAGMDDQQMIMELERIRLRIEIQLQMMNQLMASDPGVPDPVMEMVHTSLQQQLQLALQGKSDLNGFRIQVQEQIRINGLAPDPSPGYQQGGPNHSHTTTPTRSDQNGNGSTYDDGYDPYHYLTITPFQNGSGPYMGQKTPSPGTGNKP